MTRDHLITCLMRLICLMLSDCWIAMNDESSFSTRIDTCEHKQEPCARFNVMLTWNCHRPFHKIQACRLAVGWVASKILLSKARLLYVCLAAALHRFDEFGVLVASCRWSLEGAEGAEGWCKLVIRMAYSLL